MSCANLPMNIIGWHMVALGELYLLLEFSKLFIRILSLSSLLIPILILVIWIGWELTTIEDMMASSWYSNCIKIPIYGYVGEPDFEPVVK